MRPTVFLLISLSVLPGIIQFMVPRWCSRDSSVLVCTRLYSFKLQQILSTVMFEVLIDFVFLQSPYWLCNCKVLKLVQTLSVTDVIVVTTSRCELYHFRKCDLNVPMRRPDTVAGLVVSGADPRRKWAIKHHVTNLWYKIKTIKSRKTRNQFYKGILQENQDDIQAFEIVAARRGHPLILSSLMDDMSAMSIDAANLWRPATTTTTTTTTRRTTTRRPWRAPRRHRWRFRIPSYWSAKRRRRYRYRYRGKRSVSPQADLMAIHAVSESPANRTRVTCSLIRSQFPGTKVCQSTHVRRQRRKRAYYYSYNNVFPRVVPFKVFAGGQFYSIFDIDSIRRGLVRDGTYKRPARFGFNPRRYGVVAYRGRRRHMAARRRRVRPRYRGRGRGRKRGRGRGRKRGRSRGRKRGRSRGRKRGRSRGRKRGRGRGRKRGRSQGRRRGRGRQASLPAAGSHRLLTETEIKTMTRESDQRMKSFIIFFVMVAVVVTIIAILLIVAMKRTPNKRGHLSSSDGYYLWPSPDSGRLLNEHEEDIYKRRPIISVYEDDLEPDKTAPPVMPEKIAEACFDKGSQTEAALRYSTPGYGLKRSQFAPCRGECPCPDDVMPRGGPQYMMRPRSRYRHFPGKYRHPYTDKSGQGHEYDLNINRPVLDLNQSSPLVSFLNSIVKEKDGVMREDHRDQFNPKRPHRSRNHKPRPHGNLTMADVPGSENVSVQDKKKSKDKKFNSRRPRGLSKQKIGDLDTNNSNSTSSTNNNNSSSGTSTSNSSSNGTSTSSSSRETNINRSSNRGVSIQTIINTGTNNSANTQRSNSTKMNSSSAGLSTKMSTQNSSSAGLSLKHVNDRKNYRKSRSRWQDRNLMISHADNVASTCHQHTADSLHQPDTSALRPASELTTPRNKSTGQHEARKKQGNEHTMSDSQVNMNATSARHSSPDPTVLSKPKQTSDVSHQHKHKQGFVRFENIPDTGGSSFGVYPGMRGHMSQEDANLNRHVNKMFRQNARQHVRPHSVHFRADHERIFHSPDTEQYSRGLSYDRITSNSCTARDRGRAPRHERVALFPGDFSQNMAEDDDAKKQANEDTGDDEKDEDTDTGEDVKKKNNKKNNKKGVSMEDPGLSSESDMSSGKNMESIQPGRIAEIITDDDLVIRRLMSCRELPPSRYTSLSVMLNAPKCKGTLPLEDQVMVVRKTDVDPMSLITLQPVAQCAPYYDCLLRAKKRKAALSKSKKKRRRRKPPVQHDDLQSGAGPSWRPSETIPVFVHPGRPLPFPHSGVMWPLSFASAPPYSTPGYESLGTKQPVGVVPVQKIPWRPSAGIVGGETVDVPTWVSPLYKSYGIGGPFGPYGPFIDPEETAMRTEKAKRRKKPDEKQKGATPVAPPGATKPGAGSGFFKWLKNIFGKKAAKPKADKKADAAADKKAEGKTEPPPEHGPDKDAQNVAASEQVSDQDTSASSKTSDQPTPESSSKTDVTPTSESERSGDVSLTSSDEPAAPGAAAEQKMEGAPGPQASHEESEKPKVP